MKYILTLLIALLPACATQQYTPREWPSQSDVLMRECPVLELVLEGTTKLSEAEQVIARNYTLYYQCRNQNKGWIEWYNKQKENK
jgi:hypothetical protein